MQTVLISGGSGLIGGFLYQKLSDKGYAVHILTRSKRLIKDPKYVHWDIKNKSIDVDALNDANYIIHLAGANIAEKRWTISRKKEIVDSRVKSLELIYQNLKPQNTKLKALISASAVGYYGAQTLSRTFSEEDACDNDFLAETCMVWEQAANCFIKRDIRVVTLRTGMVLSPQGGALQKMLPIIKMGLGSALGSGKQVVNWIHYEDLCNMYLKAIEDEKLQGAYNAVAPEQVTNYEFMKSAANAVRRPYWFPKVPAFVLRMLLGEMSVMLLQGSKVSTAKIEKAGFDFKHPILQKALADLL